MKNNFNFLPILESLVTVKKTYALVSALDRIKLDVYVPGRTLAGDDLSQALFPFPIVENMQLNAIDIQDVHAVILYMDALKEYLMTCPVMSITVSRELSDKALAEIFSFVVSEYGTSILLDVHVDSRLLGGVKIRFKGYFKDYSWNRLTIAQELQELFV